MGAAGFTHLTHILYEFSRQLVYCRVGGPGWAVPVRHQKGWSQQQYFRGGDTQTYGDSHSSRSWGVVVTCMRKDDVHGEWWCMTCMGSGGDEHEEG